MRKCSVKRVIALAAILLMLAPAAFAAESPSVTAFRVASPVVIDGVIDGIVACREYKSKRNKL